MVGDRAFESMGTTCRVVIAGPDADAAVAAAADHVRAAAAALTRFESGSELSRLNADPRGVVPCGALLRGFVRAAVWAGEATGGLVDPTLLDELIAGGYSETFGAGVDVRAALAVAQPRRAAAGRRWWEGLRVDEASVTRPAGLRFDAGGIAKGLIADRIVGRERARELVFADCGGDVAVGGMAASSRPWTVAVRHPLEDAVAHRFVLARGGVATSGIARRVWLRPDGSPAHHLLDPSTGAPAWTGLLSATAVGRSAVEAEALAKAAYLSGPVGGRRVLALGGGLLVREDGDVEVVPANGRH